MTPEELSQQAAATAEGWRQANIARVLSEMHRYGVSLADLAEADTMPAMVTLLEPYNPAPADRNTVAGE